ncbi:MAG TPA: hypothetical protein VKB87_07235, partial [Myxococcaceae bacterium]|nr:hypothetical protein [Myxococcaceae bacterium]
MREHRREADGRRVFIAEFKRQVVQRILTAKKTLAQLRQFRRELLPNPLIDVAGRLRTFNCTR